jgi:transcriptional regulator with XRE-family HTH domain
MIRAVATPPDPRVSFGRQVRQLRKAKGWTQEELGSRAGLHWTYLGGIERGERNPSLINLAKLADALGVPIRELFPHPNE